MKSKILSFSFLMSLCIFAHAEVTPNSVAPDFKLTDMTGIERKLSDFSGKWVVLEWFNKDCPFVKKHYDSNNMQKLQKTYTDKGVVWLTIFSSAKGNQGYEEPADALKTKEALKASQSHLLADSSGAVGKLYGAKTTPHMFVISPEKKVVYAGAIDNKKSAEMADIPKATNFVAAALDASMKGKPVAVASSPAYGCAVKY